MFLSTALFGFVSDRLGRHVIFVWSMVVYSVAQFVIAFLSNPLAIDVARLVAGFAVGMQLINNDSFISELVPRATTRGRYMTAAYIFILTAIPVSAFLAAALVPHAPFGIDGWRIVVAIGAASGIIVFFVQRGLPESPRWLEVHGRYDEADAVVSNIEAHVIAEHGKPLPPPTRMSPMWRQRPGAGWRCSRASTCRARSSCRSSSSLRPSRYLASPLFVPILLVKRGFTVVHSLTYTAMIVLLAPVGGACGSFFAERIERKWQLVGCALLIGASGTVFALFIAPPGDDRRRLDRTGQQLDDSDLPPLHGRALSNANPAHAVGFTFLWSRVSSIFVGYWVLDLLGAFGQGAVFAMIAAAMLSIIVAIGVFGPATVGRSLEILSP